MKGGEVWTIMSVIDWTASYLSRQGIEAGRLEAELLMGHVLQMERVQLYMAADQPLTSVELTEFKGLVGQRLKGRSIAHITGYREFWNLRFRVPADVFVPRPETEFIVEKALEILRREVPDSGTVRILDLCCGAGNVLVSLLAELPDARGVGVDVSSDAAGAARLNADVAGVVDRLEIVCEDVLHYLDETSQAFDIVTCNPPYIPTPDWEALEPTVKDYEPRLALDGGPDGLELVRKLLPLAGQAVLERGWFLMEYDGDHQTEAVRALAAEAGLTSVEVVRDLAGIERVLVARSIASS